MKFQSFDSFEDMLKSLNKARESADSRTTRAQMDIHPGSFVEIDHGDLMVYAMVLSPDDGCTDEEEAEYSRDLYAQPHMRGYRFSKAYSEMCPQGELGDIHVSTVTRVITKEEFYNSIRAL